uniref:Uncharacterized protein n=1 Tax=viral metagenome TaxID=1070528 RepID=A0A6M3XH69_9ZZZZ
MNDKEPTLEYYMEKALQMVSEGVVKTYKRTSHPACVVLDSDGKFFFKNKHWTARELANELCRSEP